MLHIRCSQKISKFKLSFGWLDTANAFWLCNQHQIPQCTPPNKLSGPSAECRLDSNSGKVVQGQTALPSCTHSSQLLFSWPRPCQPSPLHSFLVKQKMKLSAPFPLSRHESISPFFLGSNPVAHIGFPPRLSVTLTLLNIFLVQEMPK